LTLTCGITESSTDTPATTGQPGRWCVR